MVGCASVRRELRVADHLVAGERDERRLGPVARALHVVGEPVLERLDRVVLEAGDVGKRLDRDLVHAASELGPLGPGDDLDAVGRLDRRRLDLREVEDDALLAPLLDEPAPLREREALRVVVEDRHLDRVELALAAQSETAS